MRPTDKDKKYLKHNKKLGFKLKVEEFKEQTQTVVGTALYQIFVVPHHISNLIKEEKKRYWMLHMNELKIKMFNEIQNRIEADLYKRHNSPDSYTVTAIDVNAVVSGCRFHIGDFIRSPLMHTNKKERKKLYRYTMMYYDLEIRHYGVGTNARDRINKIAQECFYHIYRYFEYVNDETAAEIKSGIVVDKDYNHVEEKYLTIRLK